VEAIRHARDRGLRVLMDLVVNHTSKTGTRGSRPRARTAAAAFRDYYVWTDDPASEDGTTKENWTWEETAAQYTSTSSRRSSPTETSPPERAPRDRQDRRVLADARVSASAWTLCPSSCSREGTGSDPGSGKRWLHSLASTPCAGREVMLMGECNVAKDDVPSSL